MVIMAEDLGVTTVYLENLINGNNFENMSRMYDNTDIMGLLEVRLASLCCLQI